MARLIVEAEATGGTGVSSGVAKPGNSDPLHVVVSVTRAAGAPRTGLASASFQVDAPVVGPGGAGVTIASVDEPRPGLYRVEIVPIPGETWKLGRYIFWVAVGAGSDKGQTVCSVLVD